MLLDDLQLKTYILDNIDIGVRVVDFKGDLIYSNYKISEMFSDVNYSRNIFYNNESTLSDITLGSCLRTGKPSVNKIKLIPEKNELKYFVVTNLPILKNKEVIGALEYIKPEESYGDLFYHLASKAQRRNIRKSSKGYTFDDFLSIEEELNDLLDKIKTISRYNYNVAIVGETGTGKEIIAQSIHNESLRSNEPFIAQNCAAIPENLLESIFFGSVEGAFTDAKNQKGLFELANKGTLLLDELNSLPIFLQAKLLRVLETGIVRPIGGSKDISVDVRLITTTNEKFEDLIKNNKLREDLYYRLGPIYLEIPPLRNRKSDIDYLTKVFIKREIEKIGILEPSIESDVKNILRQYSWPGNVRELLNVIKYLLLETLGKNSIGTGDLPDNIINDFNNMDNKYEEVDLFDGNTYNDRIEAVEKKIINEALSITDGNISDAAKLLRINRTTLQYKIKNLRIKL